MNLPELGPVAVAGLSYDAAKEKIEQQVSGQMIGTRGECLDRRAALDPGLRDGRGGAARLVHGERPLDA